MDERDEQLEKLKALHQHIFGAGVPVPGRIPHLEPLLSRAGFVGNRQYTSQEAFRLCQQAFAAGVLSLRDTGECLILAWDEGLVSDPPRRTTMQAQRSAEPARQTVPYSADWHPKPDPAPVPQPAPAPWRHPEHMLYLGDVEGLTLPPGIIGDLRCGSRRRFLN